MSKATTYVDPEITNPAGAGVAVAEPPQGGVRIEHFEQCECLRCQSAIPQQNVARNIVKETGVQNVRAYCEHCSTLYEFSRVLRNGVWTITDGVAEVTDRRRKLSFIRRLAFVRGDVPLEKIGQDIIDGA